MQNPTPYWSLRVLRVGLGRRNAGIGAASWHVHQPQRARSVQGEPCVSAALPPFGREARAPPPWATKFRQK